MRSIILFFVVIATLLVTFSSAHRENVNRQSLSKMHKSERGVNNYARDVGSKRQKRKLIGSSLLNGSPLGGSSGASNSGRGSAQRSQVQGSQSGGGSLLGGVLGGGDGVGI